MSLLAFGFVTLGAVIAALYTVLTKKVQTGGWENRSAALVFLHFGGAATILFAITPLTGGTQIQEGFWLPVAATGTLNIAILYSGMRARSLEDVSLVTPIASTTPAIVILTSIVILGEYPTKWGWLGIWLMVVGTYMLNIVEVWRVLSEKSGKGGVAVYFAPFTALTKSKGVRWAFLAALLGSVSLNYDALVARKANVAFGSGCVCLFAALGNLAIAHWRKEFRGVTFRDALHKTGLYALLLAPAVYLFEYSFRFSIVPYVGALKRLGIPFTIILAYLLLGECKNFRERFIAVLIMTTGATCIALGE